MTAGLSLCRLIFGYLASFTSLSVAAAMDPVTALGLVASITLHTDATLNVIK